MISIASNNALFAVKHVLGRKVCVLYILFGKFVKEYTRENAVNVTWWQGFWG